MREKGEQRSMWTETREQDKVSHMTPEHRAPGEQPEFSASENSVNNTRKDRLKQEKISNDEI